MPMLRSSGGFTSAIVLVANQGTAGSWPNWNLFALLDNQTNHPGSAPERPDGSAMKVQWCATSNGY